MTPDRILIIGGGASGVILAAHLLRDGDPRLSLTIVEKRRSIGAGVAYATDEPDHLLNTRVSGMSAYPDDPDHFWRWLQETGRGAGIGCTDPFCFVPRRVYRDYLNELVAPFTETDGDGRLRIVEGECVALRELARGVAVELGDGRTEIAGTAILATGHTIPTYGPDTPISGPWCGRDELGIRPDDEVVIIGTGLSMVDNLLQLRRAGHRGRITAISRRGLLPHVHAASTPLRLDPADVPFGTGMGFLLRWLRETARWAAARGHGWRDLVDALRPHTQPLWQAMTVETRRRFLRHARSFWEIHRHRLAPQVDEALRQALAEGALHIVAGRVLGVEKSGGRNLVRLRSRGGGEDRLLCDHVIDCTGILRDPAGGESPLVGQLLASGAARLDPLGIGIDVNERCALLRADGATSSRVYALGPVTRARFWEITAIPDIRSQSAGLARALNRREAA